MFVLKYWKLRGCDIEYLYMIKLNKWKLLFDSKLFFFMGMVFIINVKFELMNIIYLEKMK